jgi:hypothetical protein
MNRAASITEDVVFQQASTATVLALKFACSLDGRKITLISMSDDTRTLAYKKDGGDQ